MLKSITTYADAQQAARVGGLDKHAVQSACFRCVPDSLLQDTDRWLPAVPQVPERRVCNVPQCAGILSVLRCSIAVHDSTLDVQ